MCLSCGCNKPNEKHGDDRNITMQDLQSAAQAAEMSTEEVVTNIQQGFDQFGKAETAGVGSSQSAAGGQETGNNQPRTEDRQGGYGAGSSSGPQ